MFYPADPATLAAEIDAFLAEAKPPPGPVPKAIIAPHAGYVYSGPVAASAYASLAPLRGTIRRVVLLGPSHRVGFRGIAASSADVFRTPLGDIPLDREAAAECTEVVPALGYLDQAHEQEHSLEVHLPFLQKVLGEFRLLPLVVGQAQPEEVAAVLERFVDDPESLLVVSSDLSHYLDYDSARAVDAETARAIAALDVRHITPERACGAYPVRGLLLAAKRHGLVPVQVDLRNSGDTAGDRRRVVGYGSWLFYPAVAPEAG
jgi:AmmeMemoRadiSam system protein B